MLKSWSIENFKSIVNSGELQLAPVTVLAGLNSSGKSSLLQSILMISQTLSSPAADRPLLPNGPLVQLGTFEHILNDRSEVNTLKVGFELTQQHEFEFFKRSPNQWKINSVKINSNFSGNKDDNRNIPAIEASNIIIDRVLMDMESDILELGERELSYLKEKLEIKRFTDAEKEINEILKNISLEYRYLIPSVSWKNIYQGLFGENFRENLTNTKKCLLSLSHFLPQILVSRFKLRKTQKDTGSIKIDADKLISLIDQSKTADDIIKIIEELKVTWSKDDLNWLDTSKELEGLEIISSPQVNLAVEWITNFFGNKIRYLGPLRADPGTVQQQFAPTGELDDVGQKGEYAAVVYQANQLAQIDYYNPYTSQVEQAILQEALDKWAQYLGVASQIRTEKLNGVTWQVAMKPDQKPRLLPEVGFGVSQVLPILVMGLLAPREALLLIEQPELHLHPRVQARLGDFFMGLAKCGKQCLIETHSENLVSQLRYHIVQAGGQEKSDCMIYFVDQDETGASRFDPVEISPNGNILNWPDGFFDETMLQEDRITAASLKKRAGTAKKE